ncbi:MAG: FAD-dependent oxidoreductase [Oscillospiraceae bacterium]|nr:FAD-dependent oxidoreductase [Oscillospiraceae bacterium]
MKRCELLIVGAGVAGMAAAVAAWDSGCRNLVLADRADRSGGILPQCIHEGFGLSAFGAELTGPDYADRWAAALKRTGVQLLLNTEVLSVTETKTAILSSREGLGELGFERLILATGCRERAVGSLPIAGTRPAGIFTAGQAQALINLRHQSLGRNILILGSGDLGMIMARRFTLEGKRVIAVVEQNDHYGGMARNHHRCIEQYHIPMLYRSTVSEIHGVGRICGVTLTQLDSGRREYISCDTLITAVGLIPERELARGLGDPDWLYLAGNCHRIHQVADSAAAEAEAIGKRIMQEGQR